MKSLTQFLEAHNFLIKGHTKKQYSESALEFPVFNKKGDWDYEFKEYRYIEIGKGPFYIYNDKYHNIKHIASRGDMEGMIGCWYDDFEDFSEKDIIAEFKTIKEAVIYMLKENKLSDADIKKIIDNEDDNLISEKHGTKGYYDSDSFAYEVLVGELNDNDCLSNETILSVMADNGNYEITNLPKNI